MMRQRGAGRRAVGRHLSAGWHQELRARWSHGRPDRRSGAAARLEGRGGAVPFFTVDGTAQQAWSGGGSRTMDETRKLARLEYKSSGEAPGRGREGRLAFRQDHVQQVLICLANEMVGRRRPAARGRTGLREDAHAVRPLDRLVPDHQEQGGRHAGRCRLAKSAPTTPLPRSTKATRSCRPGSLAKASAAEAYCRRDHAVQMHGASLHLGQRHPSLVQAAKSQRDPVRRCQ